MFKSLGKVTVTAAGTAVRLTKNESTPSATVNASTVYIQALPGNSGSLIYVGDSSATVGSTGAHVGAICPKTATLPLILRDTKSAGFDLSQIWLDADTSGDGVYVGYTE